MKPLGGVLVRALRSLGLEAGVARAGAVRAWPAVARAVLGAEGDRVHAVRVDGDTLVLIVPSSSHAAEVRLRERDLVAALARTAPGSGVARVRCAPSGEREP